MSEKQPAAEDGGLRYQLSDSADTFRADLSSAGMGSIQDFDRYLVRHLQSSFQMPLPRDDGGTHTLIEASERAFYRTLHAELLDHVLGLAGAIGLGLDKLVRTTDTVRTAYWKYYARLSVRGRDNQ